MPQLDDTVKIFGGQEYDTKWRRVRLQFTNDSKHSNSNSNSDGNNSSNNIDTFVAIVGKDIL